VDGKPQRNRPSGCNWDAGVAAQPWYGSCGCASEGCPTSLLVSMQGTGKTTAAGKLALHLKKKGLKVLLVATDVYRPGRGLYCLCVGVVLLPRVAGAVLRSCHSCM